MPKLRCRAIRVDTNQNWKVISVSETGVPQQMPASGPLA
jgi:hypothetical protein